MKLEDANTGCDMQNAFQCESFVKMWGKKSKYNTGMQEGGAWS